MTLYSLFHHVDYEGETLLATYASREALEADVPRMLKQLRDDDCWGDIRYVVHELGKEVEPKGCLVETVKVGLI